MNTCKFEDYCIFRNVQESSTIIEELINRKVLPKDFLQAFEQTRLNPRQIKNQRPKKYVPNRAERERVGAPSTTTGPMTKKAIQAAQWGGGAMADAAGGVAKAGRWAGRKLLGRQEMHHESQTLIEEAICKLKMTTEYNVLEVNQAVIPLIESLEFYWNELNSQ